MRLRRGCAAGSRIQVSIHAPAWGATAVCQVNRQTNRGFNSRTRVGCDSRASPLERSPHWFQFTHPHGVRRALGKNNASADRFQFTHPHGVRQHVVKLIRINLKSFNSRTRMGCDWSDTHLWGLNSSFNSRTRMGCDLLSTPEITPSTLFQFTHPHGVRRETSALTNPFFHVSIHAPAWGATQPHTTHNIPYCVSIHAPAWGATSIHKYMSYRYMVSIHAPAWGATLSNNLENRVLEVSIHAPAWGATRRATLSGRNHRVSIHAPAWGATPRCY